MPSSGASGTILATGESDAAGRTMVLGGDEQLAGVGARAAGSTFPSDGGGVIRHYARENARLESLATATAASVGRPIPPVAFDGKGEALIDFRGPAGTIPTYSFADVLCRTRCGRQAPRADHRRRRDGAGPAGHPPHVRRRAPPDAGPRDPGQRDLDGRSTATR